MALLTKRSFESSILYPTLDKSKPHVHIFEPEFHQAVYLEAEEKARESEHGWFQLTGEILERPVQRGTQPEYADDPLELDEIEYIGMMHPSGERLTKETTENVAALKSVSVRNGYVDFDSARSVTQEFYQKRKKRAGIQYGDLLINSTGDGTIGRVSVYHYEYPAVVDGHIAIVRFKDIDLAWYTAAYLLTEPGQHQIYRFINGSSGQVEIYPDDIARLVIPKSTPEVMDKVAQTLKEACSSFEKFRSLMGSSVAAANDISS